MVSLFLRKLAFTAYVLPTTISLYPLWFLLSLPPSWRADPQGPLSRAIHLRLTRHIINALVFFRFPSATVARSPPPQKENLKLERGAFLVVPHLDPTELKGPLARETNPGEGSFDTGLLTPEMQTGPIGAFWYHPKPGPDAAPRGPSSPLVIYLHGGAYVTFDAGTGFTNLHARRFSQTADVDVLSLDYTLASEYEPNTRFPRILYEAFSTWKYATHTLSYPPSSVYISGDSAGGNLALVLARYIALYEPKDKQPAGLILHSPWVDMTFSSLSLTKNAPTDLMEASYPKWGYSALKQSHPALQSPRSPWFSPIFDTAEQIAQLPRIYIVAGGAETLLDEVKLFRDLAQGAGLDVTYEEGPRMPHDFPLMEPYGEEAKGVNTRLGEWIRRT